MSLINDALKKAQRDRSAPSGHPVQPAVESAPLPRQSFQPHPAANGNGLGRGVVLGAIIGLAVVGGGAAVWFLRPSSPTPTTTASAPIAAPTPVPAPRVDSPPAAPPTPVASAPAAPVRAPEPEPFKLQLNLPGATPPATAQPAVAEVSSHPHAPAPAPGGQFQIRLNLQDPRILAYLENARVTGIRAAADDPKLSLNNRVFKTGDIVDRELRLKLTKIEPGTLTFEDAQGQIYVKTF